MFIRYVDTLAEKKLQLVDWEYNLPPKNLPAVEDVVKPRTFTKLMNSFSIGCSQPLRIESLLDFTDILLNWTVVANFLFNLFNRVDGGGVVLAAQLVGDFRETQMQFAS